MQLTEIILKKKNYIQRERERERIKSKIKKKKRAI